MNTVTCNIFFGQALRAPNFSSSSIASAGGYRVVEYANPPGSATDHFRVGSCNCGFEKHKVKVLTVAQCAYILT
jgi:hypothetical protein